MMNKKLLFAATMATMLASCSSEDLTGQSATQSQTDIENAVNFEAYSQRGLTRSGDAGVTDNTSLATKGFGLFGYKTETGGYGEDATPNFMYNQQVTKAGSSWTYEPVKYWANEYGSNAQSDDVDQFSFFAYAPYVVNTPETGKVADDQLGITGFTRNTAQAWIAYKNGTHGLAIALTNDRSDISWNAFAANPGWGSTPNRAAIDGGTWRWPTKTDFDNMLAGFKTLPNTGNGVTSDGPSYYWSSTENDAGLAWGLVFSGSTSSTSLGQKGSNYSYFYVLAVLAF